MCLLEEKTISVRLMRQEKANRGSCSNLGGEEGKGKGGRTRWWMGGRRSALEKKSIGPSEKVESCRGEEKKKKKEKNAFKTKGHKKLKGAKFDEEGGAKKKHKNAGIHKKSGEGVGKAHPLQRKKEGLQPNSTSISIAAESSSPTSKRVRNGKGEEERPGPLMFHQATSWITKALLLQRIRMRGKGERKKTKGILITVAAKPITGKKREETKTEDKEKRALLGILQTTLLSEGVYPFPWPESVFLLRKEKVLLSLPISLAGNILSPRKEKCISTSAGKGGGREKVRISGFYLDS